VPTKRVLSGKAATRSAKPPPEEWPIRMRASAIDLVKKIRQVIFKLTGVCDIAAGARRAMAAQVWRISVEASHCQGFCDLVHVGTAARRAVDQYSSAPSRSRSG
jgi:hypothetical protein